MAAATPPPWSRSASYTEEDYQAWKERRLKEMREEDYRKRALKLSRLKDDAHADVTIRQVLYLIVGWLTVHLVARKWAKAMFGDRIVAGAPLWRSAAGLPTQLVALPLLFWHAYAFERYSLPRWVDRTDKLLSYRDELWCYIFSSLMAIDFFTDALARPQLWLHHIVCLLATAYAIADPTRSYPFFILGATVLELGSAAASLNCLSAISVSVFFAAMTFSNAIAAYCLFLWYQHADAPHLQWGRWISTTVCLILILLRQADAQSTWHAGGYDVPFTGDPDSLWNREMRSVALF
jgi:hypothetical protein